MKSKLLRTRTHQRTIVTLTSGDAYDGLFVGFDGVVVELVQASLIGTAGQAVKPAQVDGVLLVPWGQVATMQNP